MRIRKCTDLSELLQIRFTVAQVSEFTGPAVRKPLWDDLGSREKAMKQNYSFLFHGLIISCLIISALIFYSYSSTSEMQLSFHLSPSNPLLI